MNYHDYRGQPITQEDAMRWLRHVYRQYHSLGMGKVAEDSVGAVLTPLERTILLVVGD